MKFGLGRTVLSIVGATIVCLMGVVSAGGQATPRRIAEVTPEEKPLMAEQVFKNVQLLKGISVKEFMETMGFFAAATNKTCTTCHGDESGGSWERYADDPPQKQTARKMMLMVDALNRTYFGGKREVTCYSCHRNAERPKITPILAEQYGTPPPEDPEEIAQQAPRAPSPDQVLDKYVQALGGAQKLATFTSFVAKGTYQGYDEPESPVEIYAKAPGQFFQVVHETGGDSTWVDDGRSAWVTQSDPNTTPVPLMALMAGDLDGSHLESELYFPARIKQLLTNLRVGFPITGVTSILADSIGVGVDDRELTVLQGTTAAGNNVKLYFDPMSGLLVRMVRYTNLPVGFIPTEIDYTDYRDVSGIKVPFRVTKTWVDGRSVTELNSIQLNVPIDAAKFAKPLPPAPRQSAAAR
jgi:photosynthetic reaction center cytochrome c subunit